MSTIIAAQAYCNAHSSLLHPVQQKLLEETMQHSRGGMMGAPEVVGMNALLIRSLAAKKVLDIGVFTGASSLAAALAMPSDGLVVACDVSEEFTSLARGYWKEAGGRQGGKIEKERLKGDNLLLTDSPCACACNRDNEQPGGKWRGEHF